MPPKVSKAKAKAAAKDQGAGSPAPATVGLTQAELKNLYIQGAELILDYLNGDKPKNNFYKKLVAKRKYKTLQAGAREWCFKYEPEKAYSKLTIAEFQKKFPLHEHKGYSHEVRTSAGPHRESMDFDPNEPDCPWPLFHPDLFNAGVSPNFYRFSLERPRTARTLQGYEDNEELEFRDYKELIAHAPTARRLAGYQFQYALRVIEKMADEEDAAMEAMDEQREENKKEAKKSQKKQKKQNKKKDTEEDEEEEEEEEDEEVLPSAIVTARDLVLDPVLLRYIPEVLVWLGHGPKAWQEVRISDAQTRLYKTIHLMNSTQLMHMRVEAIRLEQMRRGEIQREQNATPYAAYRRVLDECLRQTAEEEQRRQKKQAQEDKKEDNLKKAYEDKKAKEDQKAAEKKKEAAEKLRKWNNESSDEETY